MKEKGRKQIYIEIAIVVLVSLFLFLFQNFRGSVDAEIETFSFRTRGEVKPDSNIIIIHFTEDDIARIGPWPIKRNYYGLLINQLSDLGVKKIGLEIFLSSRFVTQSIYDNLLRNEIEKSCKVVLSSVAGKISRIDGVFFTDSLSYPSPKLLDENLVTGHINYIYDNYYTIPLKLVNEDILEKAFAYQISEKKSKENYLLVNFISSWQQFQNYSALEFANLIYENSPKLNRFKNKIILIGISDPLIAQTIQTPFDDQLPGVGLHAFVIDNLLNSRSKNDSFYFVSMIFFPLILFGFIFLKNTWKIFKSYIVGSITILIALFYLISVFYLKIPSSFLTLPFLTLVLYEGIRYLLKGQRELKGVIDEATLLRNLLVKKEKELSDLQKELDVTGKESFQLTSKIESLQKDIDRLKENEDDNLKADADFKRKVENFYDLNYISVSMAKVVDLLKKAAPTDSTILIMGESGTGKELVAKAIHSLSNRRDNNFIAINCGALPDNLLESELFGHVRGSFTGAFSDKSGRFELADKGSIFLDEIGETTENFQVKMLRVLQSGEIEKIGSTKVQKVNVRVIAATNKNLSDLVKEKKFREDLYYRLNVITIELPPLRERKEDIEVLANNFLRADNPDLSLSKAVLQALNDYQWKGNVRELESVIKRAIIFAKSAKRNLIQLSDLPKEIVKETKYSFEDLVLESLRNKKFSHSSIVETAKELGNVNRTMISENFRGLVLKSLVENNFDIQKTTNTVSDSQEEEVRERVLLKVQTFLNNIEKDIEKTGLTEFESIKHKLASKYKNLPSKFHYYLDEVLKKKK